MTKAFALTGLGLLNSRWVVTRLDRCLDSLRRNLNLNKRVKPLRSPRETNTSDFPFRPVSYVEYVEWRSILKIAQFRYWYLFDNQNIIQATGWCVLIASGSVWRRNPQSETGDRPTYNLSAGVSRISVSATKLQQERALRNSSWPMDGCMNEAGAGGLAPIGLRASGSPAQVR